MPIRCSAEGRTDREIRRCFKRYLARYLYRRLDNGSRNTIKRLTGFEKLHRGIAGPFGACPCRRDGGGRHPAAEGPHQDDFIPVSWQLLK
jgi:hypothetical protein